MTDAVSGSSQQQQQQRRLVLFQTNVFLYLSRKDEKIQVALFLLVVVVSLFSSPHYTEFYYINGRDCLFSRV